MFSNLSLVFGLYGGPRAFFTSTYTWSAAFLTILMWRSALTGQWAQSALSIMPNVLGFSIAAVAVLTVIGDDQFRVRMARVHTFRDDESDLVVSLASFIWFISVQVSAIVLALVFSAKPFPSRCYMPPQIEQCRSMDAMTNGLVSFAGTFLTVYALLLVIGSTFHTFHLFRLYIRNPH
jgi:hypothetical protein